MRSPASLWRPSSRVYDPNPAPWDYGEGAELRKVNCEGDIYINDTAWKVSKAITREMVQIQRFEQRILVFYCNTLIREIDLCAQRSTAVDR